MLRGLRLPPLLLLCGAGHGQCPAQDAAHGWWPRTAGAQALLEGLPCVGGPGEGRVCLGGDVTDEHGRLVGSAEPADSCFPPAAVQQWVTTQEGRLVPALQRWFVRGAACGDGEGRRASRRVLLFCGGGAGNQASVAWSGPAEEARFWATRASWMRTAPPPPSPLMPGTLPPVACEGELHIGVPGLCEALPPPEWLPRYERLLSQHPAAEEAAQSDWALGAGAAVPSSRQDELAATHELIEASWREDVARGELSAARMEELLRGLRAEAAVAAAVDDSQRPRPETVGANYDFTVSAAARLRLPLSLSLKKGLRAVRRDLVGGGADAGR